MKQTAVTLRPTDDSDQQSGTDFQPVIIAAAACAALLGEQMQTELKDSRDPIAYLYAPRHRAVTATAYQQQVRWT